MKIRPDVSSLGGHDQITSHGLLWSSPPGIARIRPTKNKVRRRKSIFAKSQESGASPCKGRNSGQAVADTSLPGSRVPGFCRIWAKTCTIRSLSTHGLVWVSIRPSQSGAAMQDRLDHDRLASFSEDTTMAKITGHAVVESPKGCCVAHPLEVQIRGEAKAVDSGPE